MVRQALIGIIVILGNGEVRVVSEAEALAHAGELAYAQALGVPKYAPGPDYREMTQQRQGNTTVDNALEQAQLGR